MQTSLPFLLLVAAAAAQTAAETPSPTISDAELAIEKTTVAALPECSDAELNVSMVVLTTDANVLLCEQTLGLDSGDLLLPTIAEATAMCTLSSCVSALEAMYSVLPNCRYEDWGLQYSAQNILNYCAIDPTA